jgi:hypothetical protein
VPELRMEEGGANVLRICHRQRHTFGIASMRAVRGRLTPLIGEQVSSPSVCAPGPERAVRSADLLLKVCGLCSDVRATGKSRRP